MIVVIVVLDMLLKFEGDRGTKKTGHREAKMIKIAARTTTATFLISIGFRASFAVSFVYIRQLACLALKLVSPQSFCVFCYSESAAAARCIYTKLGSAIELKIS